MTASERLLCTEEDLAEVPCRGFRVGSGPWPLSGLVVRTGREVRAYQNRCPHAGHPLNLRPDDFLSPDGTLLMCSSHGALFEIGTGHCVEGPCAGESLVRIPVETVEGRVLLASDVDPQDYE